MIKVWHLYSCARAGRSTMNSTRDDYIDVKLNRWLEDRPHIKLIDIKYGTYEFTDSALIIYEEPSEEKRDV